MRKRKKKRLNYCASRYSHEAQQNQISEYMKSMYLRSVINSLKPKTIKATIAHGGGNQLLLRLWAS
jgi:hypothetical protein